MEMPKKVVRKIPAKIDIAEEIKQTHRQLRVAAYCRISTAQEEQLNSYDVQVRYYTEKIRSEPKWAFVGIFADSGLSGTSTKKRDEFNKMIKMCRRGKIEILLPIWIQSHDSLENEPPFEYPLNPLFSNRYKYRKRSEPLVCVSSPEHFSFRFML